MFNVKYKYPRDTETLQYSILCFCVEEEKTHIVHTVHSGRHEKYITDRNILPNIGMFHHQKCVHHFDTRTVG
jgi:hypothetical protein